MLIYCPQCHIGYNVDNNLIPKEGRKVRCSSCGELFYFDQTGEAHIVTSDSITSEENIDTDQNTENSEENSTQEEEEKKEEDKAIDIAEIYERLSAQSERLFQEEQKLTKKQKLSLMLKTMLGLNRRLNLKLIGAIFGAFVALSLYNYRYEIVDAIPFTNYIYRIFGIKAQIPGKGLEFQNVNWNYIENGNDRLLEIKGFISNVSNREIDLPIVHVELLDKDTLLLQSLNQKPTVDSLKPDSRIGIGIIIKTPSLTAKYVHLTFIDRD